jgi:hypothetical protein
MLKKNIKWSRKISGQEKYQMVMGCASQAGTHSAQS